MKKKTCGLDQRWLNFYLDGEFSPGEVRAIETHLAQCPACQQELGWLRATEVALAMVETPAPPADFTVRLMARAVAEDALTQPEASRSRLSNARRIAAWTTSGLRYTWQSLPRQLMPKVSVPESWRERSGDVVRQGAATSGRGTWRISRWLLRRQRQPEAQQTLAPGRIVGRSAATTGRGAWRVSRWLLRRWSLRLRAIGQPSR